ncbi:MAG: glycosyl hydrolase family 17 [Candidatus Syntrophosphaera sp.]|nr:glycosyl hydrolase family 17 [Candidatus Syntrophosphaera sp.]
MTKFPSFLPFLLLIAALISACASNQAHKGNSYTPAEVRSALESGQAVERSVPFIDREFSPWMNGRWIGQAVSYGCYRDGQAPGVSGPNKAEILEDLEIIVKHWNLIRVYNADDDTQRILEVISENGLPLQMMLGIWLENEENNPAARKSNIENVLRGIELANGYPDIVTAVNVGNETQVFWSGHKLDTASLIRYIRAVRTHTKVPVTTADDYNYWNKAESAQVADEIDFMVTHIYPLWNGKTLENAIKLLDETFDDVKQLHPRKTLVLGEIGWATNYNPDKKGDGEQGTLIKGEVGIKAQETFLLELDQWVRNNQITTFLFEVFDEPWKGGGEDSGPNEIEKNWGVFYQDRTPKTSFINYLSKQENKDEDQFLRRREK